MLEYGQYFTRTYITDKQQLIQLPSHVKVPYREVMPLCVKENGVNPKTVMERLGHKDIKTTLQIYTFNTDKMISNAAEMFEKIAN